MDNGKKSCFQHPDREGSYHCMKYNRYLCSDCLQCGDPNLFCKFRTSCLIWEISRHPEEYFDQLQERGS